jgi:glutathione S-transferase
MKLYDCKDVINPRRIRMALAEKGIAVETVQVDVAKGEQRGAAFRKLNPLGAVPCLELDDGVVISECAAIARYLEASQPEPRLLGSTPKEQALVAMWQRRVEDGILNAATTFFHHATPGLGEPDRYRNADWGQANKKKVVETLNWLDRELGGRTHVAGDDFSFADITALCGVDIAKRLGIEMPAGADNLKAWHARVSARPSASA